jgi:hydrogenase maturation protease
MIHRPRTLILGIGNILWADEGFGVRAVEAFHARYETDDDVLVLDGGTQGLYLVQFVEACDHLLVFDAIDYALPPGTLRVVRDEVLSAADLLGRYPARLALIGCQPLDLEDWGGPLTAPARAAIDPALSAALRVLSEWGVACRPRAEQDMDAARLLANDIDYHAYERRAPSGVADELGD